MQFAKAQRKQAKLRLALAGPAGSGKTWGALEIAKGIGGKVAVIDTERGSASLYSDRAEFDTLELTPPYTPERYIEAIRAAEKAGYDVLVIDSITHEWNGSGGCLESNDSLAGAKYKGNSWAAWNETTPRHRAFVDAIIQSPLHIIATLRSKTETVQEGGKVRKVGMKSEQRDGTEYEFALVFEIEHSANMAVATKDRTRLFHDPHKITVETGKRLLEWLSSGAHVPTPSEIENEHAGNLDSAQTIEALKIAFDVAMGDKRIDAAAKQRLNLVKEKRKAALTPQPQPDASKPAEPAKTPFQEYGARIEEAESNDELDDIRAAMWDDKRLTKGEKARLDTAIEDRRGHLGTSDSGDIFGGDKKADEAARLAATK